VFETSLSTLNISKNEALKLTPGGKIFKAGDNCTIPLRTLRAGANRTIHRGHAPAKWDHVAATKLAFAHCALLVKCRRLPITRLCIIRSSPAEEVMI